MSRLLALVSLVLTVPLLAADPTPLEKQLAVQKAMAGARQLLELGKPAEAAAALEAAIPSADGNKAFLALLREAYESELAGLEKSPAPDAARVAQLRRHLALLAGPAPAATPPAAPPTATRDLPPPSFDAPVLVPAPAGADTVPEATTEFSKGNYAAAAKLFAASAGSLTAQQKAAWAYCRVWVANQRVKDAECDAAAATALAADVADALTLAPGNAELQKVGALVIAAAKAKGGPGAPAAAGDVVETANFRVRHSGNRELAQGVARSAETLRKEIFERWSGPPAGAWAVKCDVHVHATAEAFAKATGRPSASTGNAIVRLDDGQAAERRIDLRADDTALASNALPRELTHVVLADLFPDKPAPKWAVEGMAILAGAPEEAGRYTRTLRRCARDGEWIALAELLEMKDFPKDHVTAFYCESVALTEYLLRAAGSERNFTVFLRDCHRYGSAQALKRQFNVDGPQALEAAWKRSLQEPAR